MTETTRAVIHRLFAETEHGVVADLLEQQCGVNLPLCETWTAAQLERIWFAVLKLSEGDVAKLREAVRIAQVDWRDVLVAAGFGHSLEEHRRWARTLRP